MERRFTAARPNQLWVADLTYVATWSGFCYAAFIVDVYSRYIVGWQTSMSLRTDLALDALEMAIWRRKGKLEGLVHHSARGVQGGIKRSLQVRNSQPRAFGTRGGSAARCATVVCVSVGIRDYGPGDEAEIVELSLRAWAPIFASIRTVLGREIDDLLVGDWRLHQASEVRTTLADERNHVWVAESDLGVVGFVAARCDDKRRLGEITMLAVDPPDQRVGIGTALTEVATDWLRASGMRAAVVETGGDPGHAPARRVYEGTGFTLLPIARYFKAL